MAPLRPHKTASFFWQGLLIVLPVILLAAVGFVSLRQDRSLAQHEATERARGIADELLPRLWDELTATNNLAALNEAQTASFMVDEAGELLFPPPISSLPMPKPLDLAGLNPAQRDLWQLAQTLERRGNSQIAADQAFLDWTAAIKSCQDFLKLNPPDHFAASAEYSLGLLLANTSEPKAASESFMSVINKYPDAPGDSGLPLRPLAQFKLLGLDGFSFDSFCSNMVYHPSPLSPYLLTAAFKPRDPGRVGWEPRTNRFWLKLWEEHELSRELFRNAKSSPGFSDSPFWFNSGDQVWLASRLNQAPQDSGTGPAGGKPVEQPVHPWFVCRTESQVTYRLSQVLEKALPPSNNRIPGYFGILVEVAGRPLGTPRSDLRRWREVSHGGKGASVRREYLDAFGVPLLATNIPTASLLASAAHSAGGRQVLKVSMYLTSPDDLFKRQKARTFWFGSLIMVSALAAFGGLLAAWRAFHSQLQLSDLKSNFVSSVSHELRSPIASLRLLAESLERGKITQPEKQTEYFRFIGQECRRLSGLVQNVLDFSRIEQGKKQYHFEPTDLLALTRETVNLMQTYADEKQVSLEFEPTHSGPGPRPVELSLDGRAIQQALINLIDNAIKHSAKGQVVQVGISQEAANSPLITEEELSLTSRRSHCQPSFAAKGFIKLWVQDHGPGIPPSEHERIFERFYRVGSELRRETQGVGIGLSIVKHVVEAHGGAIRVQSTPGQGSTFAIELPLEPHTDR